MSFRSVKPESLTKFNSSTSCEFLDCIESHIDNVILSDANRPVHKNFTPSSFRCSRMMWFRLRGTQPDQPLKADRVLKFKADLGTAYHSVLQKYISEALADNWIDVEDYLNIHPIPYRYNITKSGYETLIEVTDPYPIRFACDGIIYWNGEYYLLEIKTCESDTFRDLTDPRHKHIDQVKCYSTILDLSGVLFIYVDRTYGDMKCYEMRVKQYEKEDVLQKFKDIMWSVEYNIAPDPLPNGDDWCSSSMCPYFKKCKQW